MTTEKILKFASCLGELLIFKENQNRIRRHEIVYSAPSGICVLEMLGRCGFFYLVDLYKLWPRAYNPEFSVHTSPRGKLLMEDHFCNLDKII